MRTVDWYDPWAVDLRRRSDAELLETNPDLGSDVRDLIRNSTSKPADIATVVASIDGVPLGHGALSRAGSQAEVRRVFVAPEARGRGLSRVVMLALEDIARDEGYRSLILETEERLVPAVQLYRSMGWQKIEPYEPWDDSVLCMGKQLV